MHDSSLSLKMLSVASEDERTIFIKKTYLHVALAVLGFILIEMIFFTSGIADAIAGVMFTGKWTWLIVLGAFMFISNKAEKWSQSTTSMQTQYMGLFIYTLAEAIIFVPLLYIASNFAPGAIEKAALMTLFLFAGLSLVVLTTKKDFSFMRNILAIGGMVALGLIVLGIIFGFDLGIYFSFALVALAGGSILYQTSNLVHKYNTEQYVSAALGLFASLMLMFWYVLRIVISLASND